MSMMCREVGYSMDRQWDILFNDQLKEIPL